MDGGCKFYIWIFVYIFIFIKVTEQNTRQKRQISPQQPKILTQNGHLVFQTGVNHNITFKSTTGGFINVNGENLIVLAQTVKDNKQAIDELKTQPTEIPPNIDTRLTNVEQRLNNLQPTGEVQTQLTTLTSRISTLEQTVSGDITTRLLSLETTMSSLSNLRSTVTDLTNRLTSLESTVTGLTSTTPSPQGGRNRVSSRSFRRLSRRVSTLRTQVRQLMNLLTQNECSSNPCMNGGTCTDRYNGFACRCPNAWQGPTCQEDVNECSIYAGTDLACKNGATCHNTVGSFTCQCTSNWHGVRCTEKHDDCTGASNNELCGHGTCLNVNRVIPGQPKYTCICDEGWTSRSSDPACTVDVNECDSRQKPCSVDPPVQCFNIPGTFYCGQCPSGFSGNGFHCLDINECLVNNGGCSLAPRVDCVNTDGSRSCGSCPSGYVGDGVTCTWVGLCGVNNGGCHPQASCVESPGIEGRTCTCPPGYVGNGEGPVGCVSQGPVTGACVSNPCRNGGSCQTNGNSYVCVCRPGYTDQQCQTNINECASSPCQNGGTCIDQVNGYLCQCPSSITGTNCEQEEQACGGRLIGESGTFSYPHEIGQNYPHGVSCAWRIESTPGKIIKANFTRFNVEYHVTCNYDFVQINDGRSAASYTLGKFCGQQLPNDGYPINSTQHFMYFWFFSDSSVSHNGFAVAWSSETAVCGGTLTGATHGAINSPGYPGNYPHDRTCVWLVTVAPGNNVMFTFATIAIESHPNCSYDYLELRDGHSDTSPLLQKFCNRMSPAPLTTTGPDAYVKFHSDSNLSDQGFHITYTAVSAGTGCGGVRTQSEGIIMSPNYPSPYDHNGRCVWTITSGTSSDFITLTFTNMNMESSGSCVYDYVLVRDGPDENAPLIGRYCGYSVPSPRSSTGNNMYIEFSSDASLRGTGFRATYAVGCGGYLTRPTGTIQSPNYPLAYPTNKVCIYRITVQNGNAVTLTFSAFHVEGGSCSFDYVQVRDGGTEDARLLGTFCGSQIPAPLTSSMNSLWVKFKSDGSVQNTGFQATYTSGPIVCGTQLTEDTGSFTSPGHPNTYPHGVNCTWTIRVTPGLLIRLTFSNFHLEGSGSYCYYDYVELYDNSTIVPASKIGRYCGQSPPPVTTSTDNVMVVLFKADSSIAHNGFSASYVTLNASTVCGRNLNQPTGVITSPNYPDSYPHERDCVWTITAPQGMQVLLNVTDFRLESSHQCIYDYLELRNGGYENSPLVGETRYCGRTIPRIIRSHSNRMYIRFKSDASMTADGFKIIYDATSSGCGGDLTTPTGSFVSPNYPMTYHHRSECFWKIISSQGSRINLTFSAFNLESAHNCIYDFVEVRADGPQGPRYGKYCGNVIPAPILSNTSILWVKYRTDSSVARSGFYATYTTDCNNRFTAYSGVLESPNFPNPYPHNRNCTWILQTSLGNTINISFSHFTLESHSNCVYDYLQIRNGQLNTSPSLGKYCGNNLPPLIASSSQYLWIRFISDYSVAGNGFRLEYTTNGCGKYFTTPTGTFTSPNYPNNYPYLRICEWTIVVTTGSSVELNITDFDFETHHTCGYDGLDVYGGMDDSSPRLARLCHKQTSPQVLTSTGNLMFVRFRSDVSISGRGFSANYRSILGGCGGNFSVPSATITSKNYPNDYPHQTECIWRITVTAERNVVLTFQDFVIEGSSNCIFDYVKVYDGNSFTSPQLLFHCGNALPSPPVVRSTGNQMLIRMKTDSSVSSRGFKAQYVTGCGGTLNSETDGVVTSPNYPGNYETNNNCSWLIMADHEVDRIILTFTHMDIEDSDDCRHDYVRVYNGNDDNAPVIGTYCGNSVPPPITSQGSMMFVQFSSDLSVQKTGFRALYTKSASSCGGDFTAERGSFTSPGYPDSYPHNTECVWRFRVSPGNKLVVSFSVFNIESHDDCNLDYVEVRETDVNVRLIGRYCGNEIPSNLTAANGVWMKFRSDESGTGVGFVGQFSPVYGGNILGASSGQIASPLYPGQYPHVADYVWTITVDVNMRIRVTFVTMDIEHVQRGCVYDYVKFLDGGSADSPELGRYCGITLPDTFMSTTNQLRVVFHSDISVSGQGFLFNWEATSDQIPTVPPSAVPVPGCGGRLGAVPYAITTFTSPGYPNGYANSLNCVWELTTLPGYIVWLNITDIDTERHYTCGYDNITVYDNAQPTHGVLGTFCGRVGNSAPVLSTGSDMAVRFATDRSVNRTGFSINIQAVCGGRMRIPTGMIRSPNFPSNYLNSNNCSWTIIVARGRTIEITFNNTFNVAGTADSCNEDYVQLLNGMDDNSPPLGNATNGRYCGTAVPPVMETSSNYLHVRFVTDDTGSAAGFAMTYREVSVSCGGHLTLTHSVDSGYFMSPNYPTAHPHNLDCSWVITAPAGSRVQIDFVENFAIETHSACNYDYIELRDGGTSFSVLLGRYCGTTRPSTVRSTGNVLFARFRTDNSVSGVGFKAQYKIATCGGTLSGMSGTVSSPNYPNNYFSNMDCEWVIQGPTGHFLTLSITNFYLNYASGNNCTGYGEYLEIRDINKTGPVLLNICGYQSPRTVETSDSYAFIKFKSSNRQSRGGFTLTFQASVEECGGDLVAPSGTLTSPNFPGQYAHSRVCEWRIRVQQGRRVTLTFTAFNLEAGNRYCPYDYVAVYDGILRDSPRMKRLCGETLPDPVESSSHTMKVIFRTDGSVTNGGFRATYSSLQESKCGGIRTSSYGNITSPGYYTTGNYGNNTECIWILSNQNVSDTSMYVRFFNFKLEYHTSCVYDFLEIREGNSENGDLVDKFCGNSTRPPQLFSPSPYLWIRFRTDFSIVDRGFLLVYGFTDCGGILSSDYGTITSPNFPNMYNHSDSCTWLIRAPEGYRINVHFTDFRLERHSSCNFDFVQILNGGLSSSPSIGKFCYNTPPSNFTSQSNAIRIIFRSDFSVQAQGFRMTYSFTSGGCGGLFHNNQGQLMSPNYPQSYPHNTECLWDINVDSGYHLVLNFIPPFDLQAADCQYDYVEVQDALSNNSLVSRGRWCSNLTPPQQNSSSSRMVIKFRSDSNTNGNGFAANWTVGCGAMFTEDEGMFVSPGYPGAYDHNLICNYTISVDPQKFIILSFTSSVYDIEGGGSCPYDYVAVYAGNNTLGRRFGKFCGTTVPQPVSTQGTMFVQFVTDRSIAGRGWQIRYRSLECGGNFTAPIGYLRTPQQPSNYHHLANCTWLITVATDRVISLKFTSFDLEPHPTCRYDYVDVLDGGDLSSTRIGRYCGSVIPKIILTTGNVMLVNFISDYSIEGAGFYARYYTTFGVEQGCGGLLNSTSGSFGSIDADGDGSYEKNLDCMWTIMVGDNKIVRLNISTINIESHGCRYDYIKIYDGLSDDDPLLGTYCGNNAPGEVRSSSNVLYVYFHSDYVIQRSGFNATYEQEDALCGGTLVASDEPQIITSPGYPTPSTQPQRCRWTIDTPETNQHVRLNVTAINITGDWTCAAEYIEFRDQPMGDTGRSVHYCNAAQPGVFDSYRRLVQVNYATTGSLGSQGFSMTYQIATCNKTYSGYSGQIYSPRWPGLYPTNVHCEMLVTGPAGTYISLYFNYFRIEFHQNCNFDYLEIRNGSDSSAPVITQLCGYVLPDPVFATGNSLWLTFDTDRSIQRRGYDITYTASTQGMGCGGNITGINGSFTSPGYPGNYTQSHNCRWLISAPARRTVTVRIADINLIGSQDCSRHYVEVFNGQSEGSPTLGRFCGNETPAPIPSSGNKVLVKFVTDGNGSAPGFRITYTS